MECCTGTLTRSRRLRWAGARTSHIPHHIPRLEHAIGCLGNMLILMPMPVHMPMPMLMLMFRQGKERRGEEGRGEEAYHIHRRAFWEMGKSASRFMLMN